MNKQLKQLDELLMTLHTDEQLLVVAQMRREVLRDESAKAEVATWPALPAITPINGNDVRDGRGNTATADSPLRVACPRCFATVGTPCWELDSRGKWGKPTNKSKKSGQYHGARTDVAKGRA